MKTKSLKAEPAMAIDMGRLKGSYTYVNYKVVVNYFSIIYAK